MWAQHFIRRKLWPKNKVYFWRTNLKASVCRNCAFQVSRRKNATWRQHLASKNQIAIFVNTSCKERQQTFLAINLASQQKTTKLYFSSQVRKQFKLLAVPFKPLRCCLRNDKLVNCHVWKFYKDLFLNFRVSNCMTWSVNQFTLFNDFLSNFAEITSRI